jgi:O-antigen/teichoic acid export membrane protein
MSTLKLLLIGFGSRVTIIVLGLVNTILLARWLGPAGVGEYFLLLRLVMVLTVLSGFGLRQSANVFSGHHETWAGHIHSIILRFTLLSWVAAAIVGATLIFLAQRILQLDLSHKWVWMSFIILPMALYANVWNGMMIGRGRIWQLNLVQLVISAASPVLTFVFIIGQGGGPLAAMMIFLAVTLLQSLIMLVMAFRMSAGSSDAPDEAPANLSRQMLSFGLRGYPGSIADLLWQQLPVFLLNHFHGTTAVGIFSIAQQLVEKLLLPIQAMQDAIFKKVSLLSGRSAIDAMNRYVRLTWLTMTILTLTGVIFVPSAVMLLFGETYLKTAQVSRLLLPGTIVMSAALLMSVYCLVELRRPGLLSIFGWIHALTNLALSLLLIPRYAEVGAALAMVLAQFTGGTGVIIFYLYSTRTRITRLIYVNQEDIAIIRQQIGTIFGGKGAEDG